VASNVQLQPIQTFEVGAEESVLGGLGVVVEDEVDAGEDNSDLKKRHHVDQQKALSL